MIYLDKYIADGYITYHLNRIEGYTELKKLIRNNVLTLTDTISSDLEFEQSKNRPIIAMIQSEMVDNGDYDIEDEWQSRYENEETYFEINYCPITGQKIEFKIENIFDKTNDYLDIVSTLEKLSKRSLNVKKNREEYNILQKKLYNLTHSVLSF